MNPPHQEAQLSMPLLIWVLWQRKRRMWQVRVRVKESESEGESDDDEFNQHFAHLSKKDKLMVLKLIEKIDEQEETLYKQEEFVIKMIKCLEKLTK